MHNWSRVKRGSEQLLREWRLGTILWTFERSRALLGEEGVRIFIVCKREDLLTYLLVCG